MLLVAAAILVVSRSRRSISCSSLRLSSAQCSYSRIMNRVGKCEARTVFATRGRSIVSVDMARLPNHQNCSAAAEAQTSVPAGSRRAAHTGSYHAVRYLALVQDLRLPAAPSGLARFAQKLEQQFDDKSGRFLLQPVAGAIDQ